MKKNYDIYSIEKMVDPETGFERGERHLLNSVLHRTDGPALIMRHDGNGFETREWYQNGKLWRANGEPVRELYRNGEFHSASGSRGLELDWQQSKIAETFSTKLNRSCLVWIVSENKPEAKLSYEQFVSLTPKDKKHRIREVVWSKTEKLFAGRVAIGRDI